MQKNNRVWKWTPLMIAIVLALVCSLIPMTNLLFQGGFPDTADGLGHMAKVQYIAEELSKGHLPSWFPGWYCGSGATQYYVPLSYYLMAPIYIATHSIGLTFRIYCSAMYFVGAMGVWYFCKKKIGGWSGYFAIIAFCFQNFLAESLYQAGVVAQGPIFAAMPWFLYFVCSLCEKINRRNVIGTTGTILTLLLSHAMHAYMVCFCTMVVLLVLTIFKKINFRNFVFVGICILFAGGMTAFWSLVGATGVENPGVPYLLPEAGDNYAADLSWFTLKNNNTRLNISPVTMIIGLLILVLLITRCYRQYKEKKRTSIYLLIPVGIMVFTTIFSFGYHLPFWKWIPMANSLVPGRILSYTAVAEAILVGVLANSVAKRIPKRILRPVWYLILLTVLCVNMKPWARTYLMVKDSDNSPLTEHLDTVTDPYEKGRYSWIGAAGCGEAYYPLRYHYNLADGYNIEGSLHNYTLWNFDIAEAADCSDYVAKQMAFWNVRKMSIVSNQQDVIDKMSKTMNFSLVKDSKRKNIQMDLYSSDEPSSYYLLEQRNSLVIDEKSGKMGVQFPFLIQSKSNNLLDYTLDECKQYKMIYIYQLDLDSKEKKEQYEERIQKLIEAGVQVVVEPKANQRFDLFGVSAVTEYKQGSAFVVDSEQAPFDLTSLEHLNLDGQNAFDSIYNLDSVYASISMKDNQIACPVMGAKKVADGKVIFIGGNLSNYLGSLCVAAWGGASYDSQKKLNNIYAMQAWNSLFDKYKVSKSYLPDNYKDVTDHQYGYDGGYFDYDSDRDQNVVLSFTYSPRWKITIDGEPMNYTVHENLIEVHLPKGSHHVELQYGVTVYGVAGYVISILALVTFAFFLWKLDWIMDFAAKSAKTIIKKLQYEKGNA